jgi:LuxR family maltose regulon positive regulatory protein
MLAGNLDKTRQIAGHLKKVCADENPFMSAWADYLLGSIYFRQNRMAEAKHHLSEALKRRYIMDLVSPADAYAAKLLVLQAAGDDEEFKETLRSFEEFVEERRNPFFESWFFSVRTRLALQKKDYESAVKFFRNVNTFSDSPDFLFWVENPRITYCRLLLAGDSPEKIDEASGLLAGYLKYAQGVNLVLLETEVHILSAVMKKRQHLDAEAVAHLEKAVELAESSDNFYLFLEVADDISVLLVQMDTEFQSMDFVRSLSAAINSLKTHKTGRRSSRSPAVSLKLTNREMDVLTQLEQRLTNQEIADKLFVSVATVKRHTVTIYRKMGAENRRDAVLKAVREGILVLE